jgi:hypothetical protein
MAEDAGDLDADSLSVAVTWTAEDAAAYTALASAAQVVGVEYIPLTRTWALRIGAAASTGAVALWRTGAPETAAVISLITFLAVYFAPELYTKDWTSRSAHAETMKSDPGPYEATIVAISAEGVRQDADLLSTMVKWGGIQDITLSKGVMMFWSSRSSGLAVPVRCFASAADADAFMSQARRWRHAALAAAAPPHRSSPA